MLFTWMEVAMAKGKLKEAGIDCSGWLPEDIMEKYQGIKQAQGEQDADSERTEREIQKR